MSNATPTEPQRLLSLDAYRGFVMLAMVSSGLGLHKVAERFKRTPVWDFLGYQFEHVNWTGCALWDLIQPSFMFIVGVAMPYSYARRKERGDSAVSTVGHVLYRALFLVLLGIFLRSNGDEQTHFTFEDVVTQLGLGYVFVYLTLGRGLKVQLAAAVAILVGYWAWFAFTPAPDPIPVGIPEDWKQFSGGFAAHWNKHINPAGMFDRWFLNLFPPYKYVFNGGGYQTLNFVPSMATTIFGVMTGEYLRGEAPMHRKVVRLLQAGAVCLALGMALDGTIWPGVDWQWTLCPIVKKIWTPTWAIFSSGWVLLTLGAFVWLVEVQGWRRWTFPLVVVGMNSVTMYVMAGLMKGWVKNTLWTHSRAVAQWVGYDLQAAIDAAEQSSGSAAAQQWATYLPIIEGVLTTFVLWLICLWMYRRRIFIRI